MTCELAEPSSAVATALTPSADALAEAQLPLLLAQALALLLSAWAGITEVIKITKNKISAAKNIFFI